MARIETLANWVHDGLRPDLTILLDAPPSVGMSRAEQRGETDRMEIEQGSFHARVREAYLELARAEPSRFAVIDATQTLALVQSDIHRAVQRLF
jgi:dTMP kinase